MTQDVMTNDHNGTESLELRLTCDTDNCALHAMSLWVESEAEPITLFCPFCHEALILLSVGGEETEVVTH